MSDQSSPNPIKEHYIAYFDILGYQQFFSNVPEQAESLLTNIHNVIMNAKSNIKASNNIEYFRRYIILNSRLKYSHLFALKRERILELKKQGLFSSLKLYLKFKENL